MPIIFIVERCFWEFKMMFGFLVELHVWLHSYLCFSLLEKLFLNNLDTSSTLLDRLRYPCMHFIFFFVLHFFSFVSITSCFYFSYRSMVPCSPHSLCVYFFLVFGQVFWPFMPFDNHVKKGEKFENWMSFLRGSNRLRGRTSC